MATPKEVLEVLGRLGAAYPRFQLREETAELYIEMLGDLELRQLNDSAKRHIQVANFFPTIAELRVLSGTVVIGNTSPRPEKR